MRVRTCSGSWASSRTMVTGTLVRCWWYSSPSLLTCWSGDERSRKSSCSREAPSRFRRCRRASRVGSGGSSWLSPRRSTTQAPRNWSRRSCAAWIASALRPLPDAPCRTTRVGRVSVLARAACTHCRIRASFCRRPANGSSGSGSWANDCSRTLRLRAAALLSVPRSLGPDFFGPVDALSTRCWSRNGRIPRTSSAVSQVSRSCSGPPGWLTAPARWWAAGRWEAVTLRTVAAAPTTPTVSAAPAAVPAPVPSARSAMPAARAATAATSKGVPAPSRAYRCPNVSCPALASSSARVYASYSSADDCAMASSAPRARVSSTPPSVRPPDRRTSSSTARTNSRSASARWLSRMVCPLWQRRLSRRQVCCG